LAVVDRLWFDQAIVLGGLRFSGIDQHGGVMIATETITFAADGGEGMGYLARPVTIQRAPAVVVLQEWWGLDAHIKDVTERFARAGYVALAPDLYHGAVAREPDEARKLAMGLDLERAATEMIGAVNYLCGRDDVANVAVIGFCMGGSLALLLAARTPRVAAVSSWYGGRQVADADLMQISAPVLAIYGGRDQSIPPERIQHTRDMFERAGVPHDIVVYDDAPHAFFNDTRPQIYRPDAAADAWQRTLAHFERAMVAGRAPTRAGNAVA
jgi:carboxymethylenebutenolidase